MPIELFNQYAKNIYTYVLGNPLSYKDPSGKFIWIPYAINGVIGGISAGIGAYNTGARGWELAGAVGIGVGAGILSTVAFGPFGSLANIASTAGAGFSSGFGGNVAGQIFGNHMQGKDCTPIQWGQAWTQGGLGLAGAGLGLLGQDIALIMGYSEAASASANAAAAAGLTGGANVVLPTDAGGTGIIW